MRAWRIAAVVMAVLGVLADIGSSVTYTGGVNPYNAAIAALFWYAVVWLIGKVVTSTRGRK
jgi:hypothetical protein